MYDIFVIGNNPNWKKIKSKYPFAKKVTDFKEAKTKALTPMFWAVWNDIDVTEEFDFTLSVPKWDEEYVHVWKNKEYFDGLSLIPKHKSISDKELKYRFFTDKKEIDQVASNPKKYDIFEIETYEQYLEAMDKSTTDMFWMTSPNLKIADDFNFDLYISHHNAYERQENHAFVHLVNGEKLYNGVYLMSKHKPVTKKEIDHRHIIERKEWNIVASGPCEYDKFVANTYEQYLAARETSKTEMFWLILNGVTVLEDFKFDLYFDHNNTYDRNTVHVFQNTVFYDSVMLLPKHMEISKKEFESGFVVNCKEYDVMASVPVKFDKFNISTYQDYLDACEKASTGMFWAIWPDVDVVEDFEFDYYVPRYNQHITHIFKNGKHFDGVCLFSKQHRVSEKEFKYRFFAEKKEIDYVISYPKKYDIFEIETYEQYLEAMDKSSTDLFWMTTPNLRVADDFKFDLYITHHNAYERQENHAFVHLVNEEKLFNGIFLLSKHRPVTAKEIAHRFLVEKKEWDIVASSPCQYDIFEIETYEQYLEATKKSKTEMFWMTTPNLRIADDFKFDLYFSHDKVYDRSENHAFVHLVNGEKLYNGVFLLSKSKVVTAKEIDHRYIIDRKEWDIVASGPCEYDIFTVDNYDQYLEALSKSRTEMFYMVPSDITLVDDFKFDIYFSHDKKFERENHHAYLNGGFYDGVFLVSKQAEISKKEIEGKFVTQRIEEDTFASTPVNFDVFYINTYQAYLDACDQSTTNMFWCVWPDVNVVEDFDFDYYVPRYNQHITHVFKNGKHFDGICLFNKDFKVNEKEFKYRFFAEKKEIDYVISYPKKYDIFEIETYEQYLEAMDKSSTDLFWMTTPNLRIADDFKFDLYFSHHNSYDSNENHAFVHLVDDEKFYNGVFLLSKYKPVTKKEIDHRHIIEHKEWDTVASGPCEYEKFTVNNYEDYVHAVKTSKTEMFYMIPSDVNIVSDFKFDLYYTHDKEFERRSHHGLLNGIHYDGIFLVSKHAEISQKEIDGKFIINRKEEDILASVPVKFDKFKITTYQDYLDACERSSTGMFWCIWPDVEVVEDFEFDYYVPRHNQHITHVFKNGKHFDGICLFGKNTVVTEKEFKYRFFAEKKEIDYVISYPKKYDIFEIETYDQYLEAMAKSTTDLFWMTTPNLKVADDFKFDLYFSYDNVYEKTENHAFVHLVDDEKFYNGIFLLSKSKPISEKEVTFRYLIERKEWDIVASGPCEYDKFYINSYTDYVEAMKNSRTEMFWMIPREVEPLDTFKFDTYFNHHNTYDRSMNHSFKHLFRGEENFNGICLMNKRVPVSEKEITFRYLVERKEWDIVASKMKAYDIVFISYNESNADENFERVKTLYPRVKRVHGVKGIHQAHIKAAEQATTENFWVVDGDAVIADQFAFDYEIPVWERNTVHVWRSQNPVNNLVYGYGGVKLLPRQLTLDMDVTRPDMTTSISDKFKPVQVVSNITAFNTDEFSTWKSAFRECAKLAGKAIDRQVDSETEERLNVWCTEGADKPYGEFAIKGALAGRKFATDTPEDLFKINDFDWLYEQYEKDCSK